MIFVAKARRVCRVERGREKLSGLAKVRCIVLVIRVLVSRLEAVEAVELPWPRWPAGERPCVPRHRCKPAPTTQDPAPLAAWRAVGESATNGVVGPAYKWCFCRGSLEHGA